MGHRPFRCLTATKLRRCSSKKQQPHREERWLQQRQVRWELMRNDCSP
jgi:hypothetical protein